LCELRKKHGKNQDERNRGEKPDAVGVEKPDKKKTVGWTG
jgi:hypothetical protein